MFPIDVFNPAVSSSQCNETTNMDVERGEKVHASESRGVFSLLWNVLSVLALVAVLCAAVAYIVTTAGAYRSSSTSEDVFGGILEVCLQHSSHMTFY